MFEAVQTVNFDMLQLVWREVEYRLDILMETGEAHVEMSSQ